MLKDYSLYSDLELFSMVSRGQDNAFTEIYLRYVKKLKPHVARLLDSETWAEEIVQEVMIRLWEKRDALNQIDSPASYIFRMASNRTFDHLKHRAAEVKMQYWVARNAENGAESPSENLFDFRASQNLLKEAVSSLTAQKQKIFRLRHEDGYSYEEIASELKISKNTVRNHLADAHQFIRRFMLQRGVVYAVWLAFYLGF